MIRLREIVPDGTRMKSVFWWNALYHLYVLNEIRYAYNDIMICTSGWRSWEEHLRIYREINEERAQTGLPALIPPRNSPHLIGHASDWKDPKGTLYRFLEKNIELTDELGIWIEDRKYTPTHCHLQTVPPKSGNRIFKPY